MKHYEILEKVEELKRYNGNRTEIVNAIKEYNSLVHYRKACGSNFRDNTILAIDNTVQSIVEDVVSSTYGFVWNTESLPFTIRHSTQDTQEVRSFYQKVEQRLALEANSSATGFGKSLRQILKMYYEYGIGWLFLTEFPDKKTFHCSTISPEYVYFKEDNFNQLEVVAVVMSDKITYAEKKGEKWNIYRTNEYESSVEYSEEISYQPFFRFSEIRNPHDRYPLGVGISILPEIKTLNNINSELSVSASRRLKPMRYQVAGANINNSAHFAQQVGRNKDTEILLKEQITKDRMLPFGFVQYPSDERPSYELLSMKITNIRERFGFVNRLLTIKDNVEMTATEANIRNQSDLTQLRDFTSSIYSDFLTDLNISMLKILKRYKKIGVDTGSPEGEEFLIPKSLSGKKLYDVIFSYTSVYRKMSQQQRLTEISAGLDLVAKTTQVAKVLQELPPQTELTSLIQSINEITRLVPAQSPSNAGVSTYEEIAKSLANVTNEV